MVNEVPVHRVRIVLVFRAERIVEPIDDSKTTFLRQTRQTIEPAEN